MDSSENRMFKKVSEAIHIMAHFTFPKLEQPLLWKHPEIISFSSIINPVQYTVYNAIFLNSKAEAISF